MQFLGSGLKQLSLLSLFLIIRLHTMSKSCVMADFPGRDGPGKEHNNSRVTSADLFEDGFHGNESDTPGVARDLPSSALPLPGNEPETSQFVDCHQRLMTDIFFCVSSQGVDFTKFLYVVGGAKNKKADKDNDKGGDNKLDANTTLGTPVIDGIGFENQSSSSSSSSSLKDGTVVEGLNGSVLGSNAGDQLEEGDISNSPDLFEASKDVEHSGLFRRKRTTSSHLGWVDKEELDQYVRNINKVMLRTKSKRGIDVDTVYFQREVEVRLKDTISLQNELRLRKRRRRVSRSIGEDQFRGGRDVQNDTTVSNSNNSNNSNGSRSEIPGNNEPGTNIQVTNESHTAGPVAKSRTNSSPANLEDDNDFREKTCSVQKEIMTCTFESAKLLMEDEACNSPGNDVTEGVAINDQRYVIRDQVEAIIGQYDLYCAHPCRRSLLDDMRKCYEQFDLDPKIFISRDYGGAVIGSSFYDVDTFCKNRLELVQCLVSRKDECPESDMVLDAIGLDLGIMAKGFALLCDNQDAYLQSLPCFESHTSEVGYCHSVKHRKVVHLAAKADQLGWTMEQYMEEICTVRLEHIRCDLEAWSQKAETEECTQATFDLKRRVHCSLIPQSCHVTHRKSVDDVCQPPHSASSVGDRNRAWLAFLLITFTLTLTVSAQCLRPQ